MANTNTVIDVAGLPPITLSSDMDAAAEDTVDASGNPTKRAVILTGEANSQVVAILVRIQKAPNGIFLDLVLDESLATVDTRMGSTNLSGRSHPSPTEDAIDTAILAAAQA